MGAIGRTNYLFGDDGDDILLGGYANDGYMEGEVTTESMAWSGDDAIQKVDASSGVAGTLVNNNDVISGGYGNDYIRSGEGVDRIDGGPGRDFILPNGFRRDFSFDSVNCGSDGDTLATFYSGDGEIAVNCELIYNIDG